MKIDDGGPAFPLPEVVASGPDAFQWSPAERGMSLRDYFAAKAMHALLAEAGDVRGEDGPETLAEALERISACAYQYADAMLAQRTKEPT